MSTPCLIVVKLDLMTTADLTINDGCIKINLCLLKYSDPPSLSLSIGRQKFTTLRLAWICFMKSNNKEFLVYV